MLGGELSPPQDGERSERVAPIRSKSPRSTASSLAGAPAAVHVAHQRRGLAAIAAHDGVRLRTAREGLDERGAQLVGRQVAERRHREPHARRQPGCAFVLLGLRAHAGRPPATSRRWAPKPLISSQGRLRSLPSGDLGELHVPVAGPAAIHVEQLLAPGARRLMLARLLERRLDQQRHLDGRRLEHVADAFLEEMQLQGEPRHQLAGVLARSAPCPWRAARAGPRPWRPPPCTRSIRARRASVACRSGRVQKSGGRMLSERLRLQVLPLRRRQASPRCPRISPGERLDLGRRTRPAPGSSPAAPAACPPRPRRASGADGASLSGSTNSAWIARPSLRTNTNWSPSGKRRSTMVAASGAITILVDGALERPRAHLRPRSPSPAGSPAPRPPTPPPSRGT